MVIEHGEYNPGDYEEEAPRSPSSAQLELKAPPPLPPLLYVRIKLPQLAHSE